ncbi:MAG: hypothetical protein ACC652_07565 [Acidimicrobiales bacterium]
MTGRANNEYPDWLIPVILVAVGGVVVVIALITIFVVRSSSTGEDTLAGQMEVWTRCLRSEGVPVPLVEAVGDGGFRVTFDDVVMDAQMDPDVYKAAFDQCLDVAPDALQTLTGVVDGLKSLPFGGDMGWLSSLLFDLGGSDFFGDSGMGFSDMGDPTFDELCAQLDGLGRVVPDVADELQSLCASGPDV